MQCQHSTSSISYEAQKQALLMNSLHATSGPKGRGKRSDAGRRWRTAELNRYQISIFGANKVPAPEVSSFQIQRFTEHGRIPLLLTLLLWSPIQSPSKANIQRPERITPIGSYAFLCPCAASCSLDPEEPAKGQ